MNIATRIGGSCGKPQVLIPMAGPHAGNRNRPAYSGQQRFRFPKQIIQLFAPRKPIPFKPPPRKPHLRQMTGLADFVSKFEEANSHSSSPGPNVKEEQTIPTSDDKKQQQFETPAQRRRRVREERITTVSLTIAEARERWDPFEKQQAKQKTGEPFKTLFVSNIAYETLESRLQDEFETFGPVTQVIMPKDRDGVPRGYAFIQFERERDLKVAYRRGSGMRIDGRRLLIDVERGRTVKDWLPNRLDGPNNSCARRVRRGGPKG